jgi:Obg family GTPase CgtA-like protein
MSKSQDSVDREGSRPLRVIRPRHVDVDEAIVRKVDGAFVVSQRKAERLGGMVDGRNWAAKMQLYEQLRRLGVVGALERAGIEPGDVFRVGKVEWEWA